MTRVERKKLFIKQLACFLSENHVRKSIDLELGNAYAKEWAKLRQSTPIFGNPTVEETEKELIEFLM